MGHGNQLLITFLDDETDPPLLKMPEHQLISVRAMVDVSSLSGFSHRFLMQPVSNSIYVHT